MLKLFFYSFHSPDTLKRMMVFQIGKINDRWSNLVPPIQGGKFENLVDADVHSENESLDGTSSSSSTTPPDSPLFDRTDDSRRRNFRIFSDLRETSSSSSLSSIEYIDKASSSTESSVLADFTRQEIISDLARYPSLDPDTQGDIVRKYRVLHDRIRSEGLYQCNYGSYFLEICRYIFLFSMCLGCLKWGWYGTSGLFLGMFWHQLVFTAHDAGHMGITHSFIIDTLIGIFIADFLGGLSLGWWKRSHNVHHIVTNSPEHDPDIEHMPVFAVSHRFFESLKSTYYDRVMPYDFAAKLGIRYQEFLYYPILALGRFNLYRLSWEYLILGLGPTKGPAWWHRWLEIAGQLFFWAWFGYGIVYKTIPTPGSRVLFIMVSHMFTGLLHVQITLSHFAMSTTDLGVNESFPQKMLRTTMDVDCPEWLDFFHGGLQFQAIHHLYPRIPRHNLRKTQRLVQQFCKETGIPYALYGFTDGNKEVIGHLREVGRQAAILATCHKKLADWGDYGNHM